MPVVFTYLQIYRCVSCIPPGRVATYGQVAKLAGIPNGARLVGYALSALYDGSLVPWHRVVNAVGEISSRSTDDSMENVQRIRLEREGVVFDVHGHIWLATFRWNSDSG